jgi:hypothetical protein
MATTPREVWGKAVSDMEAAVKTIGNLRKQVQEAPSNEQREAKDEMAWFNFKGLQRLVNQAKKAGESL